MEYPKAFMVFFWQASGIIRASLNSWMLMKDGAVRYLVTFQERRKVDHV